MSILAEAALLAPLAPAEKPAGTATVEKLDGRGEAAHAFQDSAVTQEELERLTVPEGISDADRAQLYIASEEAVQRLAVIANLPGLLRAAGRGAFAAVARGLPDAARQLDAEGQLAAAEAFATVARERLLGPVELADVVLPLVLAGVGEGGHPQAQASWLACLQDLAAALDPATLHSRVLPAVAQHGGGSGRLLRERCLCCQLLGALAPHTGEEDLKRSLLRSAAALCQDTEWQARHAACQQLPALAAAAAAKLEEAALEGVLEELFALLEDEEALVRAAAWRALAASLDLLPLRLRRARALPALLRQCRDPEHHAEVHRAVTAGFGPLLARMAGDMEGEGELAACLLYFRGQAWRHDHATRLNCAAAFPAVLRAATPRRYGSHLHDTFTRLVGDADPEVRLAAALGLADVAAALGPDRCCQYLRQPVAALLQDEPREVQGALLERLPQLLGAFCAEGAGDEAGHKAAAAFVEPLLRLEEGSGHSWRLQLALLHAMAHFPAFFSPEVLYDRFLPLAWRHMAEGAAAVRGAAAAAAAAIWRALRKPHQRTGLYSRAVHEFGQSKSFRQRIVFVEFCCHAQNHFSSKFIKAHLLLPALTLVHDPVAGVRMRLAAAMPALRAALALPDDVALLERLNSGMSHLITDGDADVRREARKATEELKRLPVRISCGAVEGSPPELRELEGVDAARVESERDFLFDPENLDRILASIAAHDEQLRPSNARLVLGGSARGDAARCEAALRVSKLSKQRSLTAPLGGRGAALGQQSHPRSSSEAVETRRERAATGGAQVPSSAAAGTAAPPEGKQVQQAQHAQAAQQAQRASGRGAVARLGGRGAAAAGRAGKGRGAGQLRSKEAGHTSDTPGAMPAELPAGEDVGDGTEPGCSQQPEEEQPQQPEQPASPEQQQQPPQQQQPQQQPQQPPQQQNPKPAGGAAAAGQGRLGRRNPFSAAKAQTPGRPAAQPSPPAPPARRSPGAALLAPLPVAGAIPAAAAAASASGAGAGIAGLGPTMGSLSFGAAPGAGRSALRRPSLRAAASRSAAEVQQLAAKLRSAVMTGEAGAGAGAGGAARPQAQRSAGSAPQKGAAPLPASKAGPAPGAAVPGGSVSPGGGSSLAPGVHGVAQNGLGGA